MPERFIRPASAGDTAPEKKELVLETRDILDADGERIATLEMAYEPGAVECSGQMLRSSEGARGRVLRELRIRNGAATIDVLQLANAKKHGVKVLVATEDLENYTYTPNEATSPPLRNAVDVSTLLHELGHADQRHTKEYGNLLYRPPSNVEELEQMLDAFPGSRERLQRSEIEACKQTMAEHESAKQVEEDLGSAYYDLLYKDDKTEEEQERLPALEEQYLTAKRRVEELEREPIERFPDVMLLRIRALEHDATRRALRWLHEMKKKGIDLLKPARITIETTIEARFAALKAEENGSKVGRCEASIRSGLIEASPQGELEAGLATYGATKRRLRESYQGGMPTPGKAPKR